LTPPYERKEVLMSFAVILIVAAFIIAIGIASNVVSQ
jgi:hypothetical protein